MLWMSEFDNSLQNGKKYTVYSNLVPMEKKNNLYKCAILSFVSEKNKFNTELLKSKISALFPLTYLCKEHKRH
jgi:hypothetical protein